MAKIKISQLTAKGSNLANTDLLPIAEVSGAAYVTKRVSGSNVLSAGATLTVGTTAIANGTVGRVLFQGSGNVLQQSANLFWDNTNNVLGIGTSSPSSSFKLDVNGDARFNGTSTSWHGTQILNAGIRINTNAGFAGGISLDANLPVTNRLNFNNNFTIRSTSSTTSGVDISLFSNAIQNSTNTVSLVGISGSVFSTSGGNNQTNGLLINPTINLNAANVSTIFRGIHYNPTLTSTTGITHRAIETTTGNVIFNSTSGNVGIGGTSFGTSSDKVFAQYTGTAPGSSPVDAFQMYSADIVAGNAAPHIRTENGNIVKIYQETTGVGSATVASPGAGNTIKTDDTFDGYTLQQVVKALRNLGILA